ncbi:MAG TPA: hypothetical protein PKW38_02280 [Paludibacteraceae bacterium]|jgi:adenosine deaminase|nr:hypothetical protein [Paludibacteraceae bacterium]
MNYFDCHIHLTGSIPTDYWAKVLLRKGALKGRTVKELTDSMFLENSAAWEELKVCTETPHDFLATVSLITSQMIENDVSGCNFIFNPHSLIKKGLNIPNTFELLDELVKSLQIKNKFRLLFRIGVNRRDGVHELITMARTFNTYHRKYKWIEAIDINGDERTFPLEKLAPILKSLKQEEIPFTIHAGEGSDLTNSLEDALKCDPIRIGHGISAINSTDIMKELCIRNIPLEICITSNIATSNSPQSPNKHPIKTLFNNKVPILLGSDNPTFLDTTIKREYELATKVCGPDFLSVLDSNIEQTLEKKDEG